MARLAVKIGGKMSKNLRRFVKIRRNSQKYTVFEPFFWGYLCKWSKIYEPDTLLRMCENRLSESAVRQGIGRDFGYC